jgi:hypothetical protein
MAAQGAPRPRPRSALRSASPSDGYAGRAKARVRFADEPSPPSAPTASQRDWLDDELLVEATLAVTHDAPPSTGLPTAAAPPRAAPPPPPLRTKPLTPTAGSPRRSAADAAAPATRPPSRLTAAYSSPPFTPARGRAAAAAAATDGGTSASRGAAGPTTAVATVTAAVGSSTRGGVVAAVPHSPSSAEPTSPTTFNPEQQRQLALQLARALRELRAEHEAATAAASGEGRWLPDVHPPPPPAPLTRKPSAAY